MKRLVLITVLFISSTSIYGQKKVKQVTDVPKQALDIFFNQYPVNRDKAIDSLMLISCATANLRVTPESLKGVLNIYTYNQWGKYCGNELIYKKEFGNSLVVYSYILKYEMHPVRFVFEFYKPADKWELFDFKIDTHFETDITNLYYEKVNP